jgi:hypothetical protein
MVKYVKIWVLNLDTLAPKWSKFMFLVRPPFLSVSKDLETPQNQENHPQNGYEIERFI